MKTNRCILFVACLFAILGGANAQPKRARMKISEVNQASLVRYFSQFLQDGESGEISSCTFRTKHLSSIRETVWKAWTQANAEFDEEKLIPLASLTDSSRGEFHLPQELEPNAVMPYYFGKKEGEDKRLVNKPFFVYMHGSGPKSHEWSTGLKICSMFDDAPSVYFIPQIPNEGAYYRWWQKSKQYAWEKVLRQAFLNKEIDPNRIYFFGISEGGYGSQRLASYYADYLAAAGPMAGGEPLKNAPAENCRNIGFSLRTGTEDYGFYRNILSTYVKEAFDSLQSVQPDAFVHNVELIPGFGHHIDYRPTTPWLSQFVRCPYPKHVTWEDYDMDGLHRKGFYNLRVVKRPGDGTNRTYYNMQIEGNRIDIEISEVIYTTIQTDQRWGIEMKFERTYRPATGGELMLYLCDELVDLGRKVVVNVNGREVFNGRLKYDVRHLVNSCMDFFDPERLYPAGIDLEY